MRSELELEADRLFVMVLCQQIGRGLKVPDVAKILNDRRAAAARQTAQAIGLSEEEAEAAAERAQLSLRTVQLDHQIVVRRLQEAQHAVGGVFLDDQIAEVRAEISASHDLDDRIHGEIERAHRMKARRTRGRRDDQGRPQPDEVEVHERENLPAPAGLYRSLQENFRIRERLRAELRSLKFGRLWFPEQGQEQTFAQALTDLQDPEEAREAALKLYSREIEALMRSEELPSFPGSAEIARAERLRVQRQAQRLRELRTFIDLAPAPDRPGAFELVVREEAVPSA